MTNSSLPLDANLAQLLEAGNRDAIREAATKFIGENRRAEAIVCFEKLAEEKSDLDSRFIYAQLIDDGTHKQLAIARDLALSILDDYPVLFEDNAEANCSLVRFAAQRCSYVGPQEKAAELYRKVASMSNSADDYYHLSESLSHINTVANNLADSIAALEKAISLNPATYDTETNRETIKIGKAGLASANTEVVAQKRKKIGRYPLTEDFLGNLPDLIKNHIALDLRNEKKFISKSTRFFTMGSCFARNISASLNKNGFNSTHMEISEYINTTFANKAFVDWLSTGKVDGAIGDRIHELLPPGWNAQNTLEKITNTDVFILTLGVAPAFFDRATGDFVLPRPTALNSRVLAEKYEYRTTSVQENVDNVLYLINFIRRLAPDVKLVITVSPVPLIASFEFESCIAADCLSKSTMRLVAHQVVNQSGLKDIIYWPSFEVFRWAGSNASNFYAADDGAAWHVSEEKVNGTIGAFIDMFNAG
ncbi:GSCFA domain-containing protein [Herbaspirillum sp. NPDC101396]|uniref:GSCFA domain-containing protein n=1 Tax=Herbaspirillum sp. NPDC101396 TaxID=3364005 RepID=UPI00383ACACB